MEKPNKGRSLGIGNVTSMIMQPLQRLTSPTQATTAMTTNATD
jgi:hypothetical protein